MTKNKITDVELARDIKAINRDFTKGRITKTEAKSAIMTEVANYLRGL